MTKKESDTWRSRTFYKKYIYIYGQCALYNAMARIRKFVKQVARVAQRYAPYANYAINAYRSATMGGGPGKPRRGNPAGIKFKKNKRIKLGTKTYQSMPVISPTYTKKKKVVYGNGTPGSTRTHSQTIKMGPGKLLPNNIRYHHTYNLVVDNQQGLQAVDLLNSVMPKLTGNTPAGIAMARSNKNDYGSTLWELIPEYTVSGGPYASVDPKFNRKTLFINSVDSVLSVVNQSTIAATVDIYWCAPVKNEPTTPIASWEYAIQSERNNQTATTASTTVAGTATAGGIATGGYVFQDMTPQMFKDFKKKWNIKKQNTLRLAPGDSNDIRTKIVYGKKYVMRVDADTVSEYITGYTLVPLVVVRAAPVILTGSTETTYGETRIGFIHKQNINLAVVTDDQLHTTRMYQGVLNNTGLAGKTVGEDGRLIDDDEAT